MKPDLSRRQFLAHSAGIAGASLGIGLPAVGAASVAGTPGGAEIRLGWIGLGDRGKHLLEAFLSLQRSLEGAKARVTALCDVNPQRLKRALELVRRPEPSLDKPRGYSNYRALLDDRDVDAVVIATPVHLHAEETITALHASKHVYCEKPLAHTLEACLEVAKAARNAEQARRILQVGLQRRYSPRYRRSIDLVRSGDAGRVLFVRAQWHAAGNSPKDKPWIFQREKSGGMVLEQACHQFDVFNWLLGSTPLRACGFGGTSRFVDEPPGRNTMDHYGAVLEYPLGARVQLSHLSFAIPDRRFSGIYELAFTERMGIDLPNAVAWSESGATRQLLPEGGAGSLNDTQLALRGFLESIATGRAAEAGLEAGLASTKTAILCQRALELGRVVEWKELGSV